MIGGITKGSCFSGCVEYALALKVKNKEARLLYSEGLLTDTPRDIIDGFECQRHLNSRVRHWCGHISLSYSPKDAERMDDGFMVKLALEYMDKMGIQNTQFIIVRHLDSSTKSLCSAKNEHPHCHIVYNRVDNDGKCVSDSFEYYRNNEICDEMKRKYGLTYGENKDQVKTERLKGRPKTRQEIYLAVQAAKKSAKDWTTFQRELAQKGVTVRKNSDVALPKSMVFPISRTGKSSRLRRLTATADAPTMSSAKLSNGTRIVSRNPHRRHQNRCDSSLNRNRVQSAKCLKAVPIWSKDSAMHSVVSSKSDLPTTRKKRHSSTR
ncbi:relaxase/mobilization nuclease domain-containing protein [Bacteroides acidifaciens]|uniref:relaxase/mobilization nuclease domain-containing protein n=1 Tax=Bacteroides acidifaciens TaxID=85831 RepID=UPI0025A95168|nr:relaxase/mobilization nuclease domain-containing protein [Bacteroides acidifaciens]